MTAAGVRYHWQFTEVHPAGDTVRGRFRTFVRRDDLTGAERWRESLGEGESGDYPGYTLWTISTAVFERLKTVGSAPFAVMSTAAAGTGKGAAPAELEHFLRPRRTPVLWRGTLTRREPGPRPFPLIVKGRRVAVPALHLRGEFTATRRRRWEIPEIWILADPTHPLILTTMIAS